MIRAALRYWKIDKGIDMAHLADLFTRCGTGSSSAFLAAVMQACAAFQGVTLTKDELAWACIDVEQRHLQETVGLQDTLATCFGGFNYFRYLPGDEILFKRVDFSERGPWLEPFLMLVFTGEERSASDVAKTYVPDLEKQCLRQLIMREICKESVDAVMDQEIVTFGRLLNETWREKRSLAEGIASRKAVDIWETAIRCGAYGCKLMGAGGGGVCVIVAEPKLHKKIREALAGLIFIPFRFDYEGAKVVYKGEWSRGR